MDNLEVERWLVDAPTGNHWLLSERPLQLEQIPIRPGVEYEVWGPDRFAQWLGNAVLNGDLNASPLKFYSNGREEIPPQSAPADSEMGPAALRPQVELEPVLEKLSLTHAEHRPVLLSARVWTVTGILRGPKMQQNEVGGS